MPKEQHVKTWAQANKLVIHRISPCGTYRGPIDRGTNYFVLALEQLGATTNYSCEGHPNGFYVVFHAPLHIVAAIKTCGFFTVEFESAIERENGEISDVSAWSLRINSDVTEDQRRMVLQSAAQAWTKKFGPIIYSQECKHVPATARLCVSK